MPAALGAVSYEPIRCVRVASSSAAMPDQTRELEDSSQTFKLGVPVRFVSGYIRECSFSAADVVVGVSSEFAHNLTTQGTAQDENEGSPPNQPNAITTAIGAWPRDGRMGVYHANGQNIFSASAKAGQTFSQALILPGTYYRLIKDATSGFWYVDLTLTGGNAGVVNLLGYDTSSPNTAAGGVRVFFQFIETQRFYQ